MRPDPIILARFPALADCECETTSPFDPTYNCIAWAAGDNGRWWEPDPMGTCYWPEGVPRDYRLSSYAAAFAATGFSPTEEEAFAEDEERIALFAKGERPTHAARQVNAQFWTSKLGKNVDIAHPLRAVGGEQYGAVALLMKRPLSLPTESM